MLTGPGDGQLVLHLTPDKEGVIVYTHLDPATVEAAIEAQVATFQARVKPLEWLVYSHDQPADLGPRLQRHGFVAGEAETVLVLPLAEVELPPPAPAVSVGRATSPSDLAAVATIRQQTWGGDAASISRRLQQQVGERAEEVSVYMARVEGTPAATAQISHYPAQGFASLGSAATLPAYRRRGLYTALLRARLLEAQERGARFLDTEASALSRPLLERVGFSAIATVTVHAWEPAEPA